MSETETSPDSQPEQQPAQADASQNSGTPAVPPLPPLPPLPPAPPLPPLPDCAPLLPPSPEALQQLEAKARELQRLYIDTRIHWYRTHTLGPRFCFRWAGIVTILFSVELPAIASSALPHKELVLSVMSFGIAALTGLNSFYKWERTWRANSAAQISLEQNVAKWELELQVAKLLQPVDHANKIYRATSDLIVNVTGVVSAESEGFFSGLSFPQQNSAGKE